MRSQYYFCPIVHVRLFESWQYLCSSAKRELSFHNIRVFLSKCEQLWVLSSEWDVLYTTIMFLSSSDFLESRKIVFSRFALQHYVRSHLRSSCMAPFGRWRIFVPSERRSSVVTHLLFKLDNGREDTRYTGLAGNTVLRSVLTSGWSDFSGRYAEKSRS